MNLKRTHAANWRDQTDDPVLVATVETFLDRKPPPAPVLGGTFQNSAATSYEIYTRQSPAAASNFTFRNRRSLVEPAMNESPALDHRVSLQDL